MRYILIAILLGLLALCQAQTTDSSQSIPVDEQNVRKAKAVLDQAIQALGGSAYLNIQDISQEGRTYSFYHGRPTSDGTQFWRFSKYPDKDRIELTKQRDVVEIFNGDKGYEITFRGPHPQEEKDVKSYLRRRQYSLPWVLRKWLNESGVALFYENQTVTDGKSVDQVTIMNAKDQAVTLYIAVDTHLPVKKSFSWRDPTDRERNIEEESYDNYRPAQGIMTPYTVTRYYNGDMAGETFLTSVTYNQGLSDSLFDPSAPLPSHKK
jgi:hypothetical protein